MRPEAEIRISEIMSPEEWKTISATFDGLTADGRMELLLSTPAAATNLLARFQESYGRRFDWWPIDQKGDELRVSITTRASEPRTIGGFLGSDHHRLTAYWEEFVAAVKACELAYETLFTTEGGHRTAAAERLAWFIFGLRRHIRMEEDLFFPQLEAEVGLPQSAGPTAVMRAEHRQIQEFLNDLERSLAGGSCANLIQVMESVAGSPSALLRSHDMKEEQVLYPLADRVFTQEQLNELCLRMQAL